jgi:hypothetical protein
MTSAAAISGFWRSMRSRSTLERLIDASVVGAAFAAGESAACAASAPPPRARIAASAGSRWRDVVVMWWVVSTAGTVPSTGPPVCVL